MYHEGLQVVDRHEREQEQGVAPAEDSSSVASAPYIASHSRHAASRSTRRRPAHRLLLVDLAAARLGGGAAAGAQLLHGRPRRQQLQRGEAGGEAERQAAEGERAEREAGGEVERREQHEDERARVGHRRGDRRHERLEPLRLADDEAAEEDAGPATPSARERGEPHAVEADERTSAMNAKPAHASAAPAANAARGPARSATSPKTTIAAVGRARARDERVPQHLRVAASAAPPAQARLRAPRRTARRRRPRRRAPGRAPPARRRRRPSRRPRAPRAARGRRAYCAIRVDGWRRDDRGVTRRRSARRSRSAAASTLGAASPSSPSGVSRFEIDSRLPRLILAERRPLARWRNCSTALADVVESAPFKAQQDDFYTTCKPRRSPLPPPPAQRPRLSACIGAARPRPRRAGGRRGHDEQAGVDDDPQGVRRDDRGDARSRGSADEKLSRSSAGWRHTSSPTTARRRAWRRPTDALTHVGLRATSRR